LFKLSSPSTVLVPCGNDGGLRCPLRLRRRRGHGSLARPAQVLHQVCDLQEMLPRVLLRRNGNHHCEHLSRAKAGLLREMARRRFQIVDQIFPTNESHQLRRGEENPKAPHRVLPLAEVVRALKERFREMWVATLQMAPMAALALWSVVGQQLLMQPSVSQQPPLPQPESWWQPGLVGQRRSLQPNQLCSQLRWTPQMTWQMQAAPQHGTARPPSLILLPRVFPLLQ